jgi:hypothetical protein
MDLVDRVDIVDNKTFPHAAGRLFEEMNYRASRSYRLFVCAVA